MTQIPGYLTCTDAAKRLGGSRRWFQELLAAGRIDGLIRVTDRFFLVPVGALAGLPHNPKRGRPTTGKPRKSRKKFKNSTK